MWLTRAETSCLIADFVFLVFAGLPIGTWQTALQQKVNEFRASAYPESTKSTYRTHLKTYLTFCLAFGFDPVPASQQCLSQYISALSQILKFQSIKQYLNIVRLIHLEAGLPNPLKENWYISTILNGARRVLGDQQNPKLPITPQILLNIHKKLNLSTPIEALFWAALLVGFFAFLRKSNLLPPSKGFDPDKHLTRQDFNLITNGIAIDIKWSKTIQFKQRSFQVVVPMVAGSELCPVKASLHAFRLAPNFPRDPAFSFRVGSVLSVLSYSEFLSKLRKILHTLGLSPSSYAGHSLRRGGATWAFTCGVSSEFIKTQGDWKSDSYQRYLHLSTQEKSSVALKMAQGLKNFNSS